MQRVIIIAIFSAFYSKEVICYNVQNTQSYLIKSAPWTILWFRILGIFSVEYKEVVCFYVSNLLQ